MSSSDGRFGTIFMGPTPDRETTLDRLSDVTRRELWNRQTEEEYLERVKARATERVRALLLQARQRADAILKEAEREAGAMRAEAGTLRARAQDASRRLEEEARNLRDEAAALRDAAHAEGFAAGQTEALARMEQARRELAETTGVVLLGIHEQCGRIFDAWRDDMAALLREAVEKATGWVMDKDRAAVLDALLDKSMRALLDRRRLVVRVNPVDAALVTDMLAGAHHAHARVENWELAADPALEPGSLIVESDSGLVDNSRGARRSVVGEVLEHLALPAGQADEDAFAAVAQTLVGELRRQGVDIGEEGGGEAGTDVAAVHPDAAPAGTPPAASDAVARAPAPETAVELADSPDHPAFEPQPSAPDEPAGAPSGPEASPPAGAMPEELETLPELPPAGADAAPPPAEAPSGVVDLSEAEARNMVQEFLGREPEAEQAPGLPPDLADELLADMGFGPDDASAGTSRTD